MSVLDGVVIIEGKGQFWGEFGASDCSQWGLCDAALLKLLGGLVLVYVTCRQVVTSKLVSDCDTTAHRSSANFSSVSVLNCTCKIQEMEEQFTVALLFPSLPVTFLCFSNFPSFLPSYPP